MQFFSYNARLNYPLSKFYILPLQTNICNIDIDISHLEKYLNKELINWNIEFFNLKT